MTIGLFMGFTSGLAFQGTLKDRVQYWSKNQSKYNLLQLQGAPLTLPFLGMAVGICLFLGAGLIVFGLPAWFSFSISFALTLLTALLVWYQLGKVLQQLEAGGSKALDLDE
ncbi:hypothetical protein C7B64_07290 [Merismopedia glauca CCAP 1448/3]|uniref:Uncharacterized protein n=2 Tax=Merismopedia TaxID=53402 RepID=A0A2T1C620_9CYAN|nr:hypothetical protein C7B64_07290 [Merismopedia glauca CCAP 1448/3]